MRSYCVVLAAAVLGAAGCKPGGGGGGHLGGLTPETHTSFPILSGAHAADCSTCHTDAASFTTFSCTGCHAHDQELSDVIHQGPAAAGYSFDSAACYDCHRNADHIAFSHTNVPPPTCATCHDVTSPYAALPVPGLTHMPTNGADCGVCHGTTTWPTTGFAPGISADPTRTVQVDALIPAYAGTSIVSVTPDTQLLVMGMDHTSTQIDAAAMSTCSNCHATADTGVFYPGVLHASLDQLALPQPLLCSDCHSIATPVGFVGPFATTPVRTPASGEMKHDAVAWSGGVPTTTTIVTSECGTCHTTPTVDLQASWATRADGGTPVRYHDNLVAAQQPASCLDCHANSRPSGVLTSATAALPANVTFDHDLPEALADCQSCHVTGSPTQWISWSDARYHGPASGTPATCLPCHAGERPTSTAGWQSPTYSASPFDYGTNVDGETHGGGDDCATCHTGPGTGDWGGTQNWLNGHFTHGPETLASNTCVTCHVSQRPAAVVSTFDHALDGTGDCFACHQATVVRGSYVSATVPGGDWRDGARYPGDQLASSTTQKITVPTLVLTRSGQLITGMNTVNRTLYNGMLHTSSGVPAQLYPGPSASPINSVCWHCHTNDGAGNVTAFADGIFHDALDNYQANPGDPITALPQPTQCLDCHFQMSPPDIVEKTASSLIPMDHAAQLDGGGVSTINQMDCTVCHAGVGTTWADGVVHTHLGGGAPHDCAVCHYPLMADAVKADVLSGTTFKMQHRDASITAQNCKICHTGALAVATQTPAAALWKTGTMHATVGAQPAACNGCHTVSRPSSTTQSTVTYVMPQGGTATNGGQWMSHTVAQVAGADCAKCHAADAKTSGSAWSTMASLHMNLSNVGSCSSCHGTANGNGATPGAGNNLPVGVVDSTTVTTAPATAVATGTHDRIDHADVNVTGHECNFCHTQAGPSTLPSVAGKEWAQAKFHTSFGAGIPLLANGTTARCSHCHINVKPGAGYAAFDHSAITNTSGTQDCASCHSFPGTGSPTSPNWQGAAGGAPPTIVVGGFTIPQPPATSPGTTAPGISNLPHPTVSGSTTCASCHLNGLGGKRAKGYDHASSLIATNCRACHESGSDLLDTPWNGATTVAAGAGDTRPITINPIVARRGGDTCTVSSTYHFYPVDCKECHVTPTGVVTATTGTVYTSAWRFPHTERAMASSTCNRCHNDTTCKK